MKLFHKSVEKIFFFELFVKYIMQCSMNAFWNNYGENHACMVRLLLLYKHFKRHVNMQSNLFLGSYTRVLNGIYQETNDIFGGYLIKKVLFYFGASKNYLHSCKKGSCVDHCHII